MAGKLISDLNSVSTLGLADEMEIDKDVSGSRTSYKTTVKDIVDFANQNVADEYDSTSTYAVGTYVMYQSVLYKCVQATTGSFDSTKWTQVIVTDEMGHGGGGGSWTDITGTLTAGATSITLSDVSITTSSTIDIYTDADVDYTSVSVTTGSVTVTFDAQQSNMGVKVRVS